MARELATVKFGAIQDKADLDQKFLEALPPSLAKVMKVDHPFGRAPRLPGKLSRDDAVAILKGTSIFNDAGHVDIRQELAGMFLVMPMANREEADLNAMAAVYSEDLEEFPLDIIAAACRSWRRSEKFFPRIAELRAECWRVGQDRLIRKSALVDALRDPD